MKLAAVILESRSSIDLAQVIHEHMEKLPTGTDLIIYSGENNLFLCDLLNPTKYVMLQPGFDIWAYNQLLTSVDFWTSLLNYDRILIFQHDSRILKTGIEEFYEWDYVGAPWRWNSEYGGNGGFSLRNPKIMYEITLRYPWNGQINEDHWLTMHMHNFKIGKLAPPEIGKKFSCEQIFQRGTLGYHAIDKWLTKEECAMIRTQYKNIE